MSSSARAIYVYKNGAWVQSPAPSVYVNGSWIAPSAGWVYSDNQWQQFYPSTGALPVITTNTSFTAASWIPSVNIILIGGGGAGGAGITGPNGGGGGGGAGQVLVQQNFKLTPGMVYKFNIGQGGQPQAANSGLAGGAGTSTTVTDSAGNILLIARGGGGGGGTNQSPAPTIGGSGGGGAASGDNGVEQGAIGFTAGGAGWTNNKWDLGGGGGGASSGASGTGGTANIVNGAGGAGIVVTTTDQNGTPVDLTLAGGGAGGWYIFGNQADPAVIGAHTGGIGGGGGPGQNATNYGSGGGGSIGSNQSLGSVLGIGKSGIFSAGAGYQGAAYVYW